MSNYSSASQIQTSWSCVWDSSLLMHIKYSKVEKAFSIQLRGAVPVTEMHFIPSQRKVYKKLLKAEKLN